MGRGFSCFDSKNEVQSANLRSSSTSLTRNSSDGAVVRKKFQRMRHLFGATQDSRFYSMWSFMRLWKLCCYIHRAIRLLSALPQKSNKGLADFLLLNFKFAYNSSNDWCNVCFLVRFSDHTFVWHISSIALCAFI